MKSFQMKALAVAMLGLGGLVMAGSAAAQSCPAGVAIADGGAWSGKNVVAGTMSVVTGGLESPTPSACKMSSTITSNNPFAAAAAVDNSPNNEVTYRAQFLINADAIVGLDPFNGVQIFGSNAANSASTNNPTTQILKMTITGGATKNVNFIAACSNGGSDRCSTSAALAAGVNRIEIQIIMGSGTNAQMNYWINNTNSASPTGSIQAALGVAGFDNSAWVGVKAAVLGLANPTKGFMTGGTSQLNHSVFFDAFDSRRQTFIGG